MNHLGLRLEEMSPHFRKWHLDGMDGAHVLHQFDAPDGGDPHDHPWDFRSYIVSGGYTEEIFDLTTGASHFVTHLPGEAFFIEAGHIHRIVSFVNGHGAETLITPIGEPKRKSGFYQWRDGKPFHRFWDGDWQSVTQEMDVCPVCNGCGYDDPVVCRDRCLRCNGQGGVPTDA